MEDNLSIEQIEKIIKELKFEIIARENKIEELLQIVNNEAEIENEDS